ncbi:MAG: DUF5671 domain-containing protein [Candidatus Peribacteraceae bacterium]|nr:DUF5671 domain-containing protein [Candidatus Peribacteraceae bacterium]
MTSSLSTFIAHARSKDMDHQTIRLLLLSAGWKEKDISAALASESLEMPVPIPPDTGSAKEAFFHLLTFTGLYATVISLIILAFQYISRLFPDPAMRDIYPGNADVSAIRWSLAVVIIAFPLFILLSRSLHRSYVAHAEILHSGVRRWLTYLTLFVTACTITGDLITLLFYFLDGELSIRFLLKVIAILILCGVPFAYYFSVLRMDHATYVKSPLHRIFGWIAIVIAVAAVVYGVVLAGTPATGRLQRLDEQRVNDLRMIQEEILNIVYGSDRFNPPVPLVREMPRPLPATLQDIVAEAQYTKLQINDPETGMTYEYRPSPSTTYELCATFSLVRDLDYDIFWNHPAAEKCFQFDALNRQGK